MICLPYVTALAYGVKMKRVVDLGVIDDDDDWDEI